MQLTVQSDVAKEAVASVDEPREAVEEGPKMQLIGWLKTFPATCWQPSRSLLSRFPSLIAILPSCDRLGILRECLKAAKLAISNERPLPSDGTNNDENNCCFVSLMPLQGTLHLSIITVVGVDKVGANKQ